MHTTNIRNTRYLHNGDHSGDVTIRDENGRHIIIPVQDLLDYAAQVVISKRIATLEQATYKEVFGIDV